MNLKTRDICDVLNKYSNDTTLVVPEHTDVSLADEFNNIKKCSTDNRLKLDIAETKEIVFRMLKIPRLFCLNHLKK